MPTVEQLIGECRQARHNYQVQDKKMREPVFNGRLAAKTNRLWANWQSLEAQLLKEIYRLPYTLEK
jgi:hypothetical protein